MNSKVGASRLLQTCFAVSHPWNTSRQCLAMYLKIFMYLHCYNTGKNLFLSCTEMQEILKRDLKQGVYLHRPLHIGQDIKTRFYHKFYTQRELKTHEVLSNWNYTTMYIYIYMYKVSYASIAENWNALYVHHILLSNIHLCACVCKMITATCSAKVAKEGMNIFFHHHKSKLD